MYVHEYSNIWFQLTLFILQHLIHLVIDLECKRYSNIPSRITIRFHLTFDVGAQEPGVGPRHILAPSRPLFHSPLPMIS